MSIDRRDVFKIIAAGLVASNASAQYQHPDYKLKFFTPDQDKIVDRLADIIIPTDEHSPGAHEARVSRYIDLMLHYGNEAARESWQNGIKTVEQKSQSRFQRSFLACTRQQQEQLVADMADGETDPFFVALKRMTIDGYHLSPVGLYQDAGWKGDIAIDEFPGCTHPEHQKI